MKNSKLVGGTALYFLGTIALSCILADSSLAADGEGGDRPSLASIPGELVAVWQTSAHLTLDPPDGDRPTCYCPQCRRIPGN